MKVLDQSKTGNDRDGFDVNAIAVKGVQSVPEPASLLGLMAVGAISASSLGSWIK
ncbi:hypothetical protein NIES4101_28980 [Calothrix sp. NIES-4101]|nr:hypothetical protein NIES4101_28980 [Calothrix sp. NIES-4101]